MTTLTSCTGGWCLTKTTVSAEGSTGRRGLWLCFSSARHPLNIGSNLFFCSPCPSRCAFSSATVILLMWEGKQKHWKMDHVPLAAPLMTVIMVVGDSVSCLFSSPLLPRKWWRKCKTIATALQPPRHAASSIPSDDDLLQTARALVPARAGRKSSSPAHVEVLQQLPSKQPVPCYKMVPVCLETWTFQYFFNETHSGYGAREVRYVDIGPGYVGHLV